MKSLSCLVILLAGCAVQQTTDAATIRAALSPERVAALQTGRILVEAQDIGVAATLVPVARNGPVVSWRTRDAVQLSYRDGVIVATRGLGHDIMAADVSNVLAALQRGEGRYDRGVGRLDGNFVMQFETWSCQLAPFGGADDPGLAPATGIAHYREQCVTPEGWIENTYSRDSSGTMWSSQQWIAAQIGYLQTTLIKP